MTEINIKIKLSTGVKTALDYYCRDFNKTPEKYIESRVYDVVKNLAKNASAEYFDFMTEIGKTFSVTVENAGGDNENG